MYRTEPAPFFFRFGSPGRRDSNVKSCWSVECFCRLQWTMACLSDYSNLWRIKPWWIEFLKRCCRTRMIQFNRPDWTLSDAEMASALIDRIKPWAVWQCRNRTWPTWRVQTNSIRPTSTFCIKRIEPPKWCLILHQNKLDPKRCLILHQSNLDPSSAWYCTRSIHQDNRIASSAISAITTVVYLQQKKNPARHLIWRSISKNAVRMEK